ncbi:hypothetical protein JCM31598_31230 [Desulfonatronum parangueonense]
MDSNFHRQLANAFIHFMSEETEQVMIRLRPQAAEYVAEGLWHHSQKPSFEPNGCPLFTVRLPHPVKCCGKGHSNELVAARLENMHRLVSVRALLEAPLGDSCRVSGSGAGHFVRLPGNG